MRRFEWAVTTKTGCPKRIHHHFWRPKQMMKERTEKERTQRAGMRCDDQNGHKWCKMRHLGHRWVSSYFFNISQYIIVHIGCTLQNTRWGEKCKAVMTKTGPNDVKHIVYAIIRSFILTIVFRLWIPFLHHNDETRRLGWAATSKMGQNDMLCVMWAISRFFFLSFRTNSCF